MARPTTTVCCPDMHHWLPLHLVIAALQIAQAQRLHQELCSGVPAYIHDQQPQRLSDGLIDGAGNDYGIWAFGVSPSARETGTRVVSHIMWHAQC